MGCPLTAKVTRCLVMALLLWPLLPRPGVAQEPLALVRLEPEYQQIEVGEIVEVRVMLDDVEDLYGIEFRIRFDPTFVWVVDVDPAETGVQIALGDFPSPDFVSRNEADNVAGRIRYAVTQMWPSEPRSGSGWVATIRLWGRSRGTSWRNRSCCGYPRWRGICRRQSDADPGAADLYACPRHGDLYSVALADLDRLAGGGGYRRRAEWAHRTRRIASYADGNLDYDALADSRRGDSYPLANATAHGDGDLCCLSAAPGHADHALCHAGGRPHGDGASVAGGISRGDERPNGNRRADADQGPNRTISYPGAVGIVSPYPCHSRGNGSAARGSGDCDVALSPNSGR